MAVREDWMAKRTVPPRKHGSTRTSLRRGWMEGLKAAPLSMIRIVLGALSLGKVPSLLCIPCLKPPNTLIYYLLRSSMVVLHPPSLVNNPSQAYLVV